ncbi:MAG: dATP/dGTP diphosphohydrolase domain-containing protein, partial [Nanoarchaeota archaeon]
MGNDYKVLGPFDPDTKTIKTNINAKHNLTETETLKLKEKEAIKFDQEKPQMSLIPSLSLIEVAKVMTHGAKKYSAHNWMKGFDWTRLYDAAQRHLTA